MLHYSVILPCPTYIPYPLYHTPHPPHLTCYLYIYHYHLGPTLCHICTHTTPLTHTLHITEVILHAPPLPAYLPGLHHTLLLRTPPATSTTRTHANPIQFYQPVYTLQYLHSTAFGFILCAHCAHIPASMTPLPPFPRAPRCAYYYPRAPTIPHVPHHCCQLFWIVTILYRTHFGLRTHRWFLPYVHNASCRHLIPLPLPVTPFAHARGFAPSNGPL